MQNTNVSCCYVLLAVVVVVSRHLISVSLWQISYL